MTPIEKKRKKGRKGKNERQKCGECIGSFFLLLSVTFIYRNGYLLFQKKIIFWGYFSYIPGFSVVLNFHSHASDGTRKQKIYLCFPSYFFLLTVLLLAKYE